MSGVTLNADQTAIMSQFIQYGIDHGYSNSDIQIAVKAAYIESSLGQSIGPPAPLSGNPYPTASGLYGYTAKSKKGSGLEISVLCTEH